MSGVLEDAKDLFTRNLRTSGIYVAFVALIVLFTILTGGTLLAPRNVTNLVLQNAHILIMVLGMLMVIVAGHIDLSVGSVLAFASAVSAFLVIKQGMPWWVGLVAAIVVGVVVGAWHGFWVAVVGIPAFIVTLAGMLLFRGLTAVVLSNTSLSPFPAEYKVVANDYAHGLFGSRRSEDWSGQWRFAPEWAASRRVVRYDARGHGSSGGRERPEDYQWDNLSGDLLALLDQVGATEPVPLEQPQHQISGPLLAAPGQCLVEGVEPLGRLLGVDVGQVRRQSVTDDADTRRGSLAGGVAAYLGVVVLGGQGISSPFLASSFRLPSSSPGDHP